ncbi:probable galacturonosyltransferase 7 isoform X2 [Tanacetum coccineum]
MSDNIPFDIQMEIIKRVSNVKSLIQLRSVSKLWKSFIDSSDFINGYGSRHTQPHSHILRNVVGACHGLLCLFGNNGDTDILVIWNPSIGKSFGIVAPYYDIKSFLETSYGFGVRPVTNDPTVVKLVFRLQTSTQVVIDKFIYWGAWECTNTDYAKSTISHMVASFDLSTNEFKVVNLPDTLTNELFSSVLVSKLRGSLVVCGYISNEEAAGVWVMGNDSSFRKLFTIRAPRVDQILGFKKNGETILKTRNQNGGGIITAVLDVYDPCSQQIKNLRISGLASKFFMGSYKEPLLLLDHLDSHIYSNKYRY